MARRHLLPLLGIFSLAPIAAAHADYACEGSFLSNLPACVDLDEVVDQCAFEAIHRLSEDPPVLTVTLTIGVGDGVNDGTHGPVSVQLTNDPNDRIFLDRAADDFQRSSIRRYELVDHGLATLDDLDQLRISLDGPDFINIDYIHLKINGADVFESGPVFSAAFGNGGSVVISRQSMSLDHKREEITHFVNVFDLQTMVEGAIGHLMRSESDGAVKWNPNLPEGQRFSFTAVPGDPSRAHALGKIYFTKSTSLGTIEVYAHLNFDVVVECDDAVFSIAVEDFSLERTYTSLPLLLDLYNDATGELDVEIDGALSAINVDGVVDISTDLAALFDGLMVNDPALTAQIEALACPTIVAVSDTVQLIWDGLLYEAESRLHDGDEPKDFCAADVVVSNIQDIGGGQVSVTVKNRGHGPTSPFLLDVFFGHPMGPTLGEIGDQWLIVLPLDAEETRDYIFTRPQAGWVDTIVDGTDVVDERNETNNITAIYLP